MKRTGGTWDRTDQPCYFMAGATPKQLRGEMPPSGHYLVPIDDIKSDRDIDQLADYCTRAKILIDSGVFFLASRHARKHGIELAEAFRLAADQMDGFDALFDTYLRTLRRVGPLCWGYIEFDLGDAARKTQTRTDLERQGFAPIPVFHLSRDGWDYFDELASQYDRVCVGNLVDLKGRFADKTRIVHELHLRRKRHPHVWLHLLGMSPTERLLAAPNHSCDSIGWLTIVKWAPSAWPTSGLAPFGTLERETAYCLTAPSDAPNGLIRATKSAVRWGLDIERSWRVAEADRAALLTEQESHV